MRKIYIFIFILFGTLSILSKVPDIPEKYIIFENANSGIDLYIKKIEGIQSILLTESQRDPFLKKTNYGLRTKKFHPCNGNEIRILNGKRLQTKYDVYFLVDSTTEKHPELGESFHFYLPDEVLYGYKWSRNGVIKISNGSKLNLRIFNKKYADYTGEFIDQWITVKINYNIKNFDDRIINDFEDLANITKKDLLIKSKSEDISKIFEEHIINKIPIDSDADIVFIIDATVSMKEEIPVFKKSYPKMKELITKKVKNPRIGLIFYRDYGESFVTRVYGLTDDLDYIDRLIGKIIIEGGDDIPEALNEAIVELKNLEYKSENRLVFLIGDAPSHPSPRGDITRKDAVDAIVETNVDLYPICLPYK